MTLIPYRFIAEMGDIAPANPVCADCDKSADVALWIDWRIPANPAKHFCLPCADKRQQAARESGDTPGWAEGMTRCDYCGDWIDATLERFTDHSLDCEALVAL